MGPFVIAGVSAWAPGFASLDAIAEGAFDAQLDDPPAEVLGARARRGTSRVTRMLVHCATECAADAGLDCAGLPIVYGSALGETATMLKLLDQIFLEPGPLSPILFKNSVHNTASGLASIALGNRAFSTAVAASERTTEAAMLEAITWIAAEGGQVVVTLADDVLPEPLDRRMQVDPLAVAFCLRADDAPGRARSLLWLDRAVEAAPTDALPAGFRHSPVGSALALALAIRAGAGSVVPLSHGVRRPYVARLEPTPP